MTGAGVDGDHRSCCDKRESHRVGIKWDRRRGFRRRNVSPSASNTAWLNCMFVFSCNCIKEENWSLVISPRVRGKCTCI